MSSQPTPSADALACAAALNQRAAALYQQAATDAARNGDHARAADYRQRADQNRQQAEPTPVADDAHATASQLLARAADDYTAAEARRAQLSGEDRVNGQQSGGR